MIVRKLLHLVQLLQVKGQDPKKKKKKKKRHLGQTKKKESKFKPYPPAPENRVSQKEVSLPTIHVQGRTVSFREGTPCLVFPSLRQKMPHLIHCITRDGVFTVI